MKKQYYLGIDQGTTGTTVIIFDKKFNVVSKGYREIKQIYPNPGWVEHDPMEIWDSILKATQQAFDCGNVNPKEIRSIGIDNQGETVMLWNKKTGKPIYNAIVWQDKRTSNECEVIKSKYEDIIWEKTGLIVDSYFSATKIKWILDNVEGVKEDIENGDIAAGTLDSWMIWKLTGGRSFIGDRATAARTLLFNINTGDWDDELLSLFDIPKKILPELKDSISYLEETNPSDFFGVKIPITASAVDQGAALFGQGCFKRGSIKTTYGTGAFILLNTGNKKIMSKNGLLTSISWSYKGEMTYILEAGIYITGAATQWLRDGLKVINSADETEAMANSVKDNGGVYFVPAFSGLAAPKWDQYARGIIVGITGGTSKEHIVRATLESTAYQIKNNVELLQNSFGEEIKIMRVDGGATVNNFLMQFQSDILDMEIQIPKINEATALGIAKMSALGLEDFKNLEELETIWSLKKKFKPNMEESVREDLMKNWNKAMDRSEKWIDN